MRVRFALASNGAVSVAEVSPDRVSDRIENRYFTEQRKKRLAVVAARHAAAPVRFTDPVERGCWVCEKRDAGMTLRQIGDLLARSAERVRQYEAKHRRRRQAEQSA